MTEDEFYSKVSEILRGRGFDNALDRDTVMGDMKDGLTPQESAEEFIDDWAD